MITTTLNKILSCHPCGQEKEEELAGWLKLLAGLGKTQADDEPLAFSDIVRINGIQDALWCCRSVTEYDKEWRLLAVFSARLNQHLLIDKRSIDAIDVTERFAFGNATLDEVLAASNAARAAARAACATWTAASATASDAAWTASATASATWAAASAVAWAASATWTAASAAASNAASATASDAARAASDAARAAARAAAWDKIESEFLRIVG